MALFSADGQALPVENSVLELREKEQTFRFEGLAAKPIVSLLRDFSAPVTLTQQTSHEELLALLRFETDGFCKWDAAQRLAISCITNCYQSPRDEWHIPQHLMEAYRHILMDESLNPALRAELLTPPGFEDVAVTLMDIDVDRLEEARDFFRSELSQALLSEAQASYLSLWNQEDHAMNGHAYSRRKLRNVCLRLMIKADEDKSLAVCQQQFSKAQTMTDQVSSLALLVNCSQADARQLAIDGFYQQWKDDELVLDKWFALQASCERPDTLANVIRLLSHPAFNIKNPNKVRALVGAFSQSNPRYFHAIDGSGYAFLTDILIKMDQLNPQIAARLATPFTRWQRFNAPRQQLMKQQLKRLAALDLSADLQELVAKSLVN